MSETNTDLLTTGLKATNEMLCELNLRPLPSFDNEAGLHFLGIKELLTHNAKFYTDVVFLAQFGEGGTFPYPVRFNANGKISDGAVIVPVVNGRVGVIRQFRAAIGIWTLEFPRGFGDLTDKDVDTGSLGENSKDLPGYGTAFRELQEEFSGEYTPRSIEYLGSFYENSSTHNVNVAVYLAHFTIPKKAAKKLRGTEEGLSIQLWSRKKLKKAVSTHLCDAHSLAALMYAWPHIK